jgi:hypothetical protein
MQYFHRPQPEQTLYFGGAGFGSQPEHQLFWLTLFVGLSRSFHANDGIVTRWEQAHFLLNPSKFTNHLTVRRYIMSQLTAPLSTPQNKSSEIWTFVTNFWEQLIVYIPFMIHEPSRKKPSIDSSFVAMYSLPRQRFSGSLRSNDREYTYRHRLMRGIYEVRRWDGLGSHAVHAKCYKVWFSHSKVNRGVIHRHRQNGDHISLL